MEESRHGQLTVRAHFVDNVLNIQVMNARNLRPMDSNGKKDENLYYSYNLDQVEVQ